MEMSIDDFKAIQQNSVDSAVKIYALEQAVAARDKAHEEDQQKIEYWKKRALEAEAKNESKDIENSILKTYIVLSIDKVKTFVAHIANLQAYSIIYAFLLKVMPEKALSVQKDIIDGMMTMPDAQNEALRQQTCALKEQTEVLTKVASRPTTQNTVYPQQGSTTNVGCDQSSSEFRTLLPSVPTQETSHDNADEQYKLTE